MLLNNGSGNIVDAFFNSPIAGAVLNGTSGNSRFNMSSPEAMKASIAELFDSNMNETWNATLNRFDELMTNLSLYTSCFEFNKFVGVSSEQKLEKVGMGLVEQNLLWAGLVFSNMPDTQNTDDLPTFIQYKIRMDADTVDSTRCLL